MSDYNVVRDAVCSDCRVTCVGCPGHDAPEADRLAYIERRQAEYRAQDEAEATHA